MVGTSSARFVRSLRLFVVPARIVFGVRSMTGLVIIPGRLSDGPIPADIAAGGWWAVWALGILLGAIVWARRDR